MNNGSNKFELDADLFSIWAFAYRATEKTVWIKDPDALIRQLDRIREAVDAIPRRKRAPNIDDKKILEILSLIKKNPELTNIELAKITGLGVSTLTCNQRLKICIQKARREVKTAHFRNIQRFDEIDI